MENVNEKAVEDYLCMMVRTHGGVVRKFQYPGRRGAADRIFALPLDTILRMCELKRPKGGEHSVHQIEDADQWASVGVEILQFHTIEDIREWFENYDRAWDL